MKKQVLLRWFWSVLEYLMVLPIILIISGFAFDKNIQLLFTLSLPFHMLISIVITVALKKITNLVIALITILYIAGITALWMAAASLGTIEELSVIIISTCFFFIWGIRAGIGASSRSLFFYSAGLIVYGISTFLINKSPLLEHLTITAVVFAVIYVIAGLPFANRRFLLLESREKSSLKVIPGSVVRGNTIITTGIIALILILSLWDALVSAVVFAAKGIAFIIGKIIDFFASLYQPLEQGSNGPGMEDMPLLPAEDSGSIIAVILNILSILFVLFMLFVIIRYIVKNFKRICRAAHEILSGILGSFRRWGSAEQGYFDRQESILKTELPKKPWIIKRFFKREPRWRDMKDNASRVRFIYTRFVTESIRKGFNFSCTDTPSETIKRIAYMNKQDEKVHEKIKSAYNSARYSREMPGDETVNELKNAYLK